MIITTTTKILLFSGLLAVIFSSTLVHAAEYSINPIEDVESSTPATVPDTPIAEATTNNQGNFVVTWDSVSDNNSSIFKYTIYHRMVTTHHWFGTVVSADSNSYTFENLNYNQDYEFRVAAKNGVGSSNYSATASTVDLFCMPPDAPIILSVEKVDSINNPDKFGFLITWSEPANNGSPIAKYSIYWQIHGPHPDTGKIVEHWYGIGTDSKDTTEYLELWHEEYTFKMKAENGIGSSEYSEPVRVLK